MELTHMHSEKVNGKWCVNITPDEWIFGSSQGVKVVATRRGLEVHAWYDSFVGLVHGVIPWADIDKARELLTEIKA